MCIQLSSVLYKMNNAEYYHKQEHNLSDNKKTIETQRIIWKPFSLRTCDNTEYVDIHLYEVL